MTPTIDDDSIVIPKQEVPTLATVPFPISKVKLYEQCAALGIWGAVRQSIDSDETTKTRFELATVLMSDDPDLRRMLSALAVGIGKTEQELADLLASCAAD